MFNNNIKKPAKTVFLPLTLAKTRKKLGFTSHWQKLANPDNNSCKSAIQSAIQHREDIQHYNAMMHIVTEFIEQLQ